MKVLILEDDKFIAHEIKVYLELDNYEVDLFYEPKTMLEQSKLEEYDIFLFDVNLPKQNGFETLKEIRNYGLKTPTIFLTSNSDINSLKSGFESGGNGYMRKPFHLEELKIRMNQLIFKGSNKLVKISNAYSFDLEEKKLYENSKEVVLSIVEDNLLYILIKNSPNIINNSDIIDYVWKDKEICNNTLRTTIKKIRDKIYEDFIINIRGIGYKIEKSE